MITAMAPSAVSDLASLIFRVGIADLASWQEAAVSFGFVLVMLLVGFLLERLGVDRHA